MSNLWSRATGSLTAGQRWTAALACGLAVLMLLFGAPDHVLFVAAPPGTPRAAVAAAASAPTTPAGPVAAAPTRPSRSNPDTSAPVAPAAPGSAAVGFVALTSDDPSLPRGDAAMARAFLGAQGLTAPVLPIGADPTTTCAAVTAAAATVVLAAEDLPAALSECLLAAGVTIVGHATSGSSTGGDGAGAVVSTRWGVDTTLAELGRWGQSDVLRGRVALVVDGGLGEQVDRGIEQWAALGIDVATVVRTSGEPNDDASVVRQLADAGSDVVVFVVPTQVQRRIAPLASLLLDGPRFVVADAFDALWDELYVPVFDGAIARSTAIAPWFTRAHGEPPQQTACREVWEGAATPPVTLPGEELRMLEWCAVAELAKRASASGASSISTKSFTSPLTSAVTNEGGQFGPSEAAVLVWRANCTCWTESDPMGGRA